MFYMERHNIDFQGNQRRKTRQICSDIKSATAHVQAWRYYAGANVSTMISLRKFATCADAVISKGLLATIQHTRTRRAYGIEGGVSSDCIRGTCCLCCTLIQDEKEIQKREQIRNRAAVERGTVLMSPYTSPGPMTYPPPSS